MMQFELFASKQQFGGLFQTISETAKRCRIRVYISVSGAAAAQYDAVTTIATCNAEKSALLPQHFPAVDFFRTMAYLI